ncbi:alpha/beta-hydrolase [Trichodelitschia bisporula]|uniref:Alpha/beta-hydrolase n=1 Tax=Trichodelitschia bisporula TaxID=703511 RepID=A0A6G1HWV0_9PEZI|nr:alpha/beta-hydrolase [Trichodelitschia bisporula]
MYQQCPASTGPALAFAAQAERLGLYTRTQEEEETGLVGHTQAVAAKFVTAQDPVVQTAEGGRLPAVPLEEALVLNALRGEVEGEARREEKVPIGAVREGRDGALHGIGFGGLGEEKGGGRTDASLGDQAPVTHTNPLFPQLPMYGPPTRMRNLECKVFAGSSAVGSFCFLMVIVLGALFTSVPDAIRRILKGKRLEERPLWELERKCAERREEAEREWKSRSEKGLGGQAGFGDDKDDGRERFVPTEGGPDPLVCDVGYYARRVGLDSEKFLVQTEDGFIIELWHLYNPLIYKPRPPNERGPLTPDVFTTFNNQTSPPDGTAKYPVLLIPGLLQSAGTYCSTDYNSLAFFLAHSGLDVWLGNNRCGSLPRHALLKPDDPRMWAWNIRQMGVLDLPALISRVLRETRFKKLALVAHSQGTAEVMVALAKEQRPEIGDCISVVCLLAPAAYAGPLIGKMYFKFMKVISPGMFRVMFGIRSFISLMLSMRGLLPPRIYGFLGYRVFSFLFDWTDERWDNELRNRCFQFAPVYVSAESMRWWLGRECFARHKCILSTREEMHMENQEDSDDEAVEDAADEKAEDRGRYAWYDEHVPPMAIWVAGRDDLVDGQRLLRRFERGREPFVEVVRSKVIDGYSHLDVLWAVDSVEQVGREVLESIWKTAPKAERARCRIPVGCEKLEVFKGRRGDT